jgi:PIN domain nuclease of toxin-antitoxin system
VPKLIRHFPDKVVLDASYLIPLLDSSHSHFDYVDRFKSRLSGSVASAVNLAEVFYILNQKSRRTTAAMVESILIGYGITIEPFTVELARHFNELKEIDRKGREEQVTLGIPSKEIKRLSFADMACLSQANELNLPVLTGDMHWFKLGKHGLTTDLISLFDQNIVF